jgi:hypothetical protein
MSLSLTSDMLSACYDFLAETHPFNRWGLPPAEDVIFKVVLAQNNRGWYQYKNGNHIIAISSSCIKRTDSLTATMAHEMIHLCERHAGFAGRGEHSKAFKKLAAQVCRHHGWDEALF